MNNFVTKDDLKEAFDGFTIKLFQYLEKRFDAIDKRFEQTDRKFDALLSTVDGYAKQVEIYHRESIARDARVDRLEIVTKKIANKVGVKLEY